VNAIPRIAVSHGAFPRRLSWEIIIKGSATMLASCFERQMRTLKRRSNDRLQYGGGLLSRQVRFAAAPSLCKELPA